MGGGQRQVATAEEIEDYCHYYCYYYYFNYYEKFVHRLAYDARLKVLVLERVQNIGFRAAIAATIANNRNSNHTKDTTTRPATLPIPQQRPQNHISHETQQQHFAAHAGSGPYRLRSNVYLMTKDQKAHFANTKIELCRQSRPPANHYSET